MILLTAIAALLVLIFGFVVIYGAPYVPSQRREVEAAFDVLRPLSKKDMLVDVGSGDGVVLRVAASRGAKAIGYELNPLLVVVSRLLSRHQARVRVEMANFWREDLPAETTVVYAFSVSRDMARLEKKMQGEADRLGQPLHLIIYAMKLPGKKPVGEHRAHILYRFTPLHHKKP